MDKAKFKQMIKIGLEHIQSDNVDFLTSSMIKEIVRCLDHTAPVKTLVLNKNQQGKFWFDEDLQTLQKQRDEAYRVARLSKGGEDWEVFRQLRNRMVDMCRKAKRNHLEEKLDKNKQDPKGM